jgi:hypothetical protein
MQRNRNCRMLVPKGIQEAAEPARTNRAHDADIQRLTGKCCCSLGNVLRLPATVLDALKVNAHGSSEVGQFNALRISFE